MEWAEIDGDWWNLSAARTKAGRPHRVFLGSLAREVLRLQENPSLYVFESGRQEGAAIHPDSLTHAAKRLSDALVADGTISEPFRVHDLRRTAATGMARVGVDRHILSRVLNHAYASVTAMYDLHRYDDQVRAAHETWTRHLASVVSQ